MNFTQQSFYERDSHFRIPCCKCSWRIRFIVFVENAKIISIHVTQYPLETIHKVKGNYKIEINWNNTRNENIIFCVGFGLSSFVCICVINMSLCECKRIFIVRHLNGIHCCIQLMLMILPFMHSYVSTTHHPHVIAISHLLT